MVENSGFPPARTDARRSSGPISLVAHLLLLVGAAGAVFLAGGSPEGSLGVFLILAGIALVGCPPQARVDWKYWGLGAGMALAASLALLPYRWFPEPSWRPRLLGAGVPLGSSVTTMPEETLFWVSVLAMTAIVGLQGLAQPLRSKSLLLLTVLAVGVCALYSGLAIYVAKTGWEYPFDANPDNFGFFANGNQTSTFLVMGCMLAIGVLGSAFGGRHWFAGALAAAGLAICGTGLIFFTTSRGGLISLVVGTIFWIGGLGAGYRSKPLLVSFVAVFIAVGILFLSSQSAVQQRILQLVGLEKPPKTVATATAKLQASPASAEERVSLDTRLLIFWDTLSMIGDAPLTGTGLGSFRWIGPQYRERLLWESPLQHPESDWLMLAAEAGIPAVLLLLLGIGLLVKRVWPQRGHPYWPLRWGILCAALAALLHGFVDVPAHRPALGWWILVLGGMGLQIFPRQAFRSSRLQHGLFVLAGCGTLAFGIHLVRSAWLGGPSSALTDMRRADFEIAERRLDGKWPEAATAARMAIKRWPLHGGPYFALGSTLLKLGGHEDEVDSLFRAQRLIYRDSPDIAIQQGEAWGEIDPGKAADLFLEAVRTQERLDRNRRSGAGGALMLYASLCADAAEKPEIQRRLLAASWDRSDLVLTWLERATPLLVSAEIPRVAANPAFVASLTGSDRRRFLHIWYRKGDRDALFHFIEERPDWHDIAWTLKIQRQVDSGKFEEATRAAAEHYGANLTLPAPGTIGPDAPARDPADAVGAFYAAWQQGNTISARRVLKEASAGPSVPAEIWQLSAALSAFDGQWAVAWRNFDRYLHEVHADSWP